VDYQIKNYQIENVSPQPHEDVAFGLIKSIPEFISFGILWDIYVPYGSLRSPEETSEK
jgi:hypothetical protein